MKLIRKRRNGYVLLFAACLVSSNEKRTQIMEVM